MYTFSSHQDITC